MLRLIRLLNQRLINCCVLFLALSTITRAIVISPHEQKQSSHFVPERQDLAVQASTAVTLHSASTFDHRTSTTALAKRQRITFDQLWTHLRIGTLWIVWSKNRLNALTNPEIEPPGKFLQSLKDMYSEIRRSILNEWAKLPEQSFIRVTFGRLVFTLLPPADRTVPWSVLEEAVYALLLMVSAGLGGLVTGTYLPIATSVAFYYYLQVIAPVPEGQIGGPQIGGPTIDPSLVRRPPARRPPGSPSS
ncbi:hypothetical protein ACLMJK_004694 [Lecanora helva]